MFWVIIGILLLAVNVFCAALNIHSQTWWLLPVNGIGIYFSIRIIHDSIKHLND